MNDMNHYENFDAYYAGMLYEYQEFVKLTAGNQGPVMAGLGLAGEVGEVVELIKKEAFHSIPVDKDKMLKELGDVIWYLAAAANSYGLQLTDIINANVQKLRERYPNGFVGGGGKRPTKEEER